MDIRKSYVIDAPPYAVWSALTDAQTIERWGGGPAVMAAVPGFEFGLWDGSIHGMVLEVDPPNSIVQEWYGGEWDAPSIARFTLTAMPDGRTRLDMENTGVPDDEGAEIDAGWDEYYLGPLKALLEGTAAS
jgi:uncharacterized protein YndB with AHSA1/START domain